MPLPNTAKFDTPAVRFLKKIAPFGIHLNFRDSLNLQGIWPEKDNACMIWFKQTAYRLYSLDELKTIATFEEVISIQVNRLYRVTRNPQAP